MNGIPDLLLSSFSSVHMWEPPVITYLLWIHGLYLNGMESGFEVFYCSITCGVWGMEFFLFLVSGFLGRGISLALEFLSFSLPCLTLLLGVVRVLCTYHGCIRLSQIFRCLFFT
jgi:hypothetical protein